MTPKIVVCGLGPGGQDRLTEATLSAFDRVERRYLRTSVHPTAVRAATSLTFDSLYEEADSFADVYRQISASLVEEARRHGEILYAVPGSPLVLEQSVVNLREMAAAEAVEVEVMPAMSFLDEVWATLLVDPVEEGVRLVDGHQFATAAAGQTGPLLVAHTHSQMVLSEIKLAADLDDSHTVIVLQRLGTELTSVSEIPWSELDKSFEPDHLTSVYIPRLASPVGFELARSVEMMRRLRSDCPWDAKQTHGSLRKYLIEESYEVLDVLDRLDETQNEPSTDSDLAAPVPADLLERYSELEEELGDLWFQVLFHAALAEESGHFGIADVARTLYDKMVQRHPHVFAAGDAADVMAEPSVESWERIKQQEKQRESVLDDIPASLPALSKAEKVIKRASRAGIPPVPVDEKGNDLAVLLASDAGAADVGNVLLSIVSQAVGAGVDPELALRSALDAAVKRFRTAEATKAEVAENWLLG